MVAAAIRVPVPARREDPCWKHGEAAPIAGGCGPRGRPPPGGGGGREGPGAAGPGVGPGRGGAGGGGGGAESGD